jgi:AraC-like DNA-binding protein
MAAIVSRHAPADGGFQTAIGGLVLHRCSSATQPAYLAQWPCFGLVLGGEKSLELGEEIFRYGVGDYLVVAIDVPVACRVTKASAAAPHLGLALSIDPVRLNDVMSRMDLNPTMLAPPRPGAVAVNAASSELIEATLRLLKLLDHPEDRAGMAPIIEQEILYRLLTGPFGSRLLHIALTDTPGHKIARAVGWLREHFTAPLRIEALAAHVGMSVSSMHLHFKAVTLMTPLQYQKHLRLHEARRLMLVERLDVGAAGYQVGYQSPSQFSREYRRHYGAPPLRDVRPARLSVGSGTGAGRRTAG